jgi:hypothetical protein
LSIFALIGLFNEFAPPSLIRSLLTILFAIPTGLLVEWLMSDSDTRI